MGKTMTAKNSSLIEYYLPFFLLFSQYKFGLVTLGEIVLLILVAHRIIKDGFVCSLRRDRGLTILIVYVVFRLLLNILIQGYGSVNSAIQWIVISFSAVYLTDVAFNEDRLYKSWKIAALLYIFGLVFQYVMVLVFGKGIEPISIIPGYSLGSAGLSIRPSSFFSEPALFVCALIPLLFMALKREDYVWGIVVTVAMVASTSTVGIILGAFLWVAFLFLKNQSAGKRIGLIILFCVLVFAIMNIGIFSEAVNKLDLVIQGESTVGSRLICGLDTIRTMSATEWIFGTAYNNLDSYLIQHMHLIPNSSPVRAYMSANAKVFLNSFSQIIFSFGLIGFVLYLNAIYRRLFWKRYEAKIYLFMMLISIFAQSKFMNSIFFMELMFLHLYDRKYIDENQT